MDIHMRAHLMQEDRECAVCGVLIGDGEACFGADKPRVYVENWTAYDCCSQDCARVAFLAWQLRIDLAELVRATDPLGHG